MVMGGNSQPQMVTVTQDGTPPTLMIVPSSQNVGFSSGTTYFSVSSNADWTAICDSSWCNVTPSGSGNGTLVADYLENPYYSSRTATITVVVAGVPNQIVTVNQDHSTVSVADHAKNEITVYPNPAKGSFTIQTIDKNQWLEIDILDLTGNIILSKSCRGELLYLIDMTGSFGGCYFIKIRSNDQVIIQRLIMMK